MPCGASHVSFAPLAIHPSYHYLYVNILSMF